MFDCFAFLPVITPLDVETIATPSPFKTLGNPSESEYFLKPGLLILSSFLITGSLVYESYLSAILIEP